VRSVLVDRLQRRFTSSVTTVIAGAGFGKSTALAQAVRHNAVAPLGIDAWVSCTEAHENAEQLATSILAALGDPVDSRLDRGAAAVEALVSAMVARSPLDVCVVLDDCHVIPPGSSSERLLGLLIRRLPSNGHLLLSGRRIPDVPLARHRAAGRFTAVGSADLAFTPAEVAAASELLGRDPASVGELGGWPALVRLALVAPPGVDREFLREEVLGELPDALRRALVALVVLGPATEQDVRALGGDGGNVDDVDLAGLAERLPLISTTEDGRYSAHQLWEDVALATLSADELVVVRRRAHEVLLRAGELHRAGAMAIANEDWEALGRVAVELVSRSLSILPSDTARSWLARVPPDHANPAIRLLSAATRYIDDAHDEMVNTLLDDVIADSRARGDLGVEIPAIAMTALVAHGRNDVERLLPLAVRATELSGRVDDPVLRLLACALPAITADLRGEPETVLEAFEQAPWGRLPAEFETTAQRLRVQALWMSGLASDSIAIAEEAFGRADDSHIRELPALARWFAGDPYGLAPWRGAAFEPGRTERDHFVRACLWTVILAGVGDSAQIARIWRGAPVATLAFDNARDSAHMTYAMAAKSVVDHDEGAAVDHFRRHLGTYPVTDALGERHLRRWPALGYVLSPELRQRWDDAELGPDHRMARECARAVLTARAGRPAAETPTETPTEAPTEAQLLTQLPLPWTVELACRWHTLGDRRGHALAAFLSDVVGQAARAELRWLAANARRDRDCADGASALLRQLPAVPSEQLDIRVLGPLQLLRGGRDVHDPALRRSRVRQLLGLLVTERTVRRDRAADLLWPRMSREAASSNLRVTLAHLRRLIEPDRAAGDAGFHLRADATTIALHESPRLTVDLWRWNELHAELARPRRDPNRDQQLLAAVAELWRGDPLDELAAVEGTHAPIERLRLQHVAALLRLGDLHVATGHAAAALDCGQQVLDSNPYSEHAHRLTVAALLQMDDPSGIGRALQRLDSALDELGVEPEAATGVLRRQAMWRYGARLTSPAESG
jgi:DNA-binding SARP family transcriptional activator